MENKYYTPEIEDFHVGFEYEVMIPEKSIWSKEVFFLNDSHIDLVKWVTIQDEFTIHKVRVKCLDQSDVESSLKEYYFFKFTNDTDFEFNIGGLLYCGIFTKTDSMISFYENGWENCIFRGTIKNKSELIKLMQQLNFK